MNIKSQELRIGNFVLDDEGNVVKIEMIQSAEFAAQDRGGSEFYFSRKGHDRMLMCHEVHGIPIIKEMLLNTELKSKCDRFDYEDFELAEVAGGYRLSINEGEYHVGMVVKYLHELQNMFFSFIGKELEINL